MAVHVPDARSGRLLFAGWVVVVASFLAAVLYTQHHVQSIDVASDEIAWNAMPTVKHLGEARDGLGRLLLALQTHLGASPSLEPSARADIDGSLRTITDAIEQYLALPLFPGERPLWEDVQRSTQRLASGVHRMMGQLDGGDPRRARETWLQEVTPAAGQLHDALSRDIEFNAQNGARVAEHIKAVRVRGEWIGISLGALCALVAMLAGFIIHRQMRRHELLAEDYLRVLEERASELDNFARRVAHDINNPNGAAQLAVELESRRQRAAGAAPSEHLQRAQRSLKSIQALVEALLGFARSAARPQPGAATDVGEVIEDVVYGATPRATNAHVTLTTDVAPAGVACARGVLISLVGNLVDNAIKYSGEDGRIAIRTLADARAVRVEVEDSGPGLPPDLGDRVFDPYVRAPGNDKPGLGLGLATVKRLVDAHGGRVGFRTSPGLGTTFWFELPRASLAADRTATARPDRSAG